MILIFIVRIGILIVGYMNLRTNLSFSPSPTKVLEVAQTLRAMSSPISQLRSQSNPQASQTSLTLSSRRKSYLQHIFSYPKQPYTLNISPSSIQRQENTYQHKSPCQSLCQRRILSRSMLQDITISIRSIESFVEKELEGTKSISSSHEELPTSSKGPLYHIGDTFQYSLEKALEIFETTKGYEAIKSLFGLENIYAIESIHQGQITLSVTKDNTSHTIIIDPNPHGIDYWSLPYLVTISASKSGSSKYFNAIPYSNYMVPFTQNKTSCRNREEQKQKLSMLKEFEKKVTQARLDGVPGAELLTLPKLVKEPYGQTIFTYDRYGQETYSTILSEKARGKIISKENAQQIVRDLFVASTALESLGYHNTDIKLENSILLDIPQGRVASIDLDTVASHEIILTLTSLFYPMRRILSSYPEIKDYITHKSYVYKYLMPISILREYFALLGKERSSIVYFISLCQSIQTKLDIRRYPAKLEKYPEASILIAQSPSQFIKTLSIYLSQAPQLSSEQKRISLKEMEQLYTFIKQQECTYTCEYDSLEDKINLLPYMKEYTEIIAQHMDALLTTSRIDHISTDEIPPYCHKEDGAIYSHIPIFPPDRPYGNYDFIKGIRLMISCDEHKERIIQKTRELGDIPPSISDAALGIFFKAIHKPEEVFSNRSLEELDFFFTLMKDTVASIIESEKYTPCVIPQTIHQYIPIYESTSQ